VPADRGSALVYGSALVLVLVAAAALLIGLVQGDARPVGASLLAAGGAVLLLWVGVVRSSGRAKRDRQG
jgi:hypothetical protein